MTSPAAATSMIDATGVGSSRNAASTPSVASSTRSSASRGRLRVARAARRRRRPAASIPARRSSATPSERHVEPPDRLATAGGAAARSASRRAVRTCPAPARPQPEPAAATGAGRSAECARSVGAIRRARRRTADAAAAARPAASSPRPRTSRWVGRTVSGCAGRRGTAQDVVERRVLLARSAHPPLVAVAERGLVAVMAVGDRDRARLRPPGSAAPPAPSGSPSSAIDPQPVADAVVVGDLDGGARRADRRRALPRRRRARPRTAPTTG